LYITELILTAAHCTKANEQLQVTFVTWR